MRTEIDSFEEAKRQTRANNKIFESIHFKRHYTVHRADEKITNYWNDIITKLANSARNYYNNSKMYGLVSIIDLHTGICYIYELP